MADSSPTGVVSAVVEQSVRFLSVVRVRPLMIVLYLANIGQMICDRSNRDTIKTSSSFLKMAIDNKNFSNVANTWESTFEVMTKKRNMCELAYGATIFEQVVSRAKP